MYRLVLKHFSADRKLKMKTYIFERAELGGRKESVDSLWFFANIFSSCCQNMASNNPFKRLIKLQIHYVLAYSNFSTVYFIYTAFIT